MARTVLATMAAATMTLTAIITAAMTMACSTPLSLRGARVMQPGELEVIVSPQVRVDVLTLVKDERPPRKDLVVFTPEVSARFGIADRLDLQLRVDQTILPEVTAGYQLVGDPGRDDDVAVTVTGGFKVTWLGWRDAFLNIPVQLLVDVRLNNAVALTGGLRVVGMGGVGVGGPVIGVAPGVTGGVRFTAGRFVIHPELGVSTDFASGDFVVQFITANPVPRPLLAATFGLNVGGTFDFREPPTPR